MQSFRCEFRATTPPCKHSDPLKDRVTSRFPSDGQDGVLIRLHFSGGSMCLHLWRLHLKKLVFSNPVRMHCPISICILMILWTVFIFSWFSSYPLVGDLQKDSIRIACRDLSIAGSGSSWATMSILNKLQLPKQVASLKAKEVPGFVKETVTKEKVTTGLRKWLDNYRQKYIDTGSVKPLNDTMILVFALSYALAWPTEIKHMRLVAICLSVSDMAS